ncbi:MBL fold metallo-hydrolase [Eubacteriales bacterium OttesenSCG-928-N13]|nr:MBL fold metallo-hydrolase [Eubacteriales bacterium OttesenSCG-928-N13]
MLHVERLLAGPYGENAYLAYLSDHSDALMVDPGGQSEMLLSALRKSGKQLSHILLTHGHFDHILATYDIAQATGAKVVIHKLDAPMLMDPAPLKLPEEYAPLFHPMQPDLALEEGPITLCGMEIELIHTPGHTPGGACYYIPAHRAIFTGDTVFAEGYGRTDFSGGNMQQMRQSLLRLFQLPNDVIAHPGHGDSASMAQIVNWFQ